MKKFNQEKILLIALLVLAFSIRVFRLNVPDAYLFDEVYHAFTAVEMAKGNKAAWEWWNTPPKGFAYEWTHPPLAKEAMAIGIRGFGEKPFAWRFPVVLAGVGVVYLVYLLGKKLFNERVGLIAAFLINFDGLFFVQSRIGMNDTFFLFFMLLAFYLFLGTIGQIRPIRLIGMGMALGLALASKWTAIYGLVILGGLFLLGWRPRPSADGSPHAGFTDEKSSHSTQSLPSIGAAVRVGLSKIVARHPFGHLIKFFLIFLILPLSVYLLSYLPFFTSGHTWQQFNELQHQMWWYHTRLQATHSYTSPWYTWPFLYRPVWYYVRYGGGNGGVGGNEGTVANIYAMGNPAIWWPGIVAIGFMTWKLLRSTAQFFSESNREHSSLGIPQKIVSLPAISLKTIKNFVPSRSSQGLIVVLVGYFGFLLPWAFSPRIMFLYHYLPSLPFMCLALGYGLDNLNKIKFRISNFEFRISWIYLLVVLAAFIYFYPHLSALPMPKWWVEQYFWFPSWK